MVTKNGSNNHKKKSSSISRLLIPFFQAVIVITFCSIITYQYFIYTELRKEVDELQNRSVDVTEVVDYFYKAAKGSKVWMSKQEMSLVMSYLDKNMSMLEVGSGYSTLWFSQFVKNYVSIEHNEDWYKKVEKMIDVLPGNRNISYFLSPVKKYTGDGTELEFIKYLSKIDEVSRFQKWDIVLDDGRARVPVANRVLKYLKPSSLVIIHDFWVREWYHSVLNSYTVVASIHKFPSIVILKPKKQNP